MPFPYQYTVFFSATTFKQFAQTTGITDFNVFQGYLYDHNFVLLFTQYYMDVRPITAQQLDFRIPYARDNQKIAYDDYYSSITLPHRIFLGPQELQAVEQFVKSQRYSYSPRSSRGQSIEDLKQSPALNAVKTVMPVNKFLKESVAIDTQLGGFYQQDKKVTDQTLKVLYHKYAPTGRIAMEHDFATFFSKDITPTATHTLYHNCQQELIKEIKQLQNINTPDSFYRLGKHQKLHNELENHKKVLATIVSNL